MRVRHSRLVERTLEETGLPYEIVEGRKHYHVRLAGQMVAILPKGGKSRARQDGFADRKVAHDIRKAAIAIKEGRKAA